jgi:hypothetical protein
MQYKSRVHLTRYSSNSSKSEVLVQKGPRIGNIRVDAAG